MKRVGSLVIIVWVIAGFIYADGWQWIGPSAGNIQQILPDRNHPAIWYVVNNGVLYRSGNGAQSWQVTALNQLEDVYGLSQPVAINSDSSQLYVTSLKPGGSRLWVSQDQGKTFQ